MDNEILDPTEHLSYLVCVSSYFTLFCEPSEQLITIQKEDQSFKAAVIHQTKSAYRLTPISGGLQNVFQF